MRKGSEGKKREEIGILYCFVERGRRSEKRVGEMRGEKERE